LVIDIEKCKHFTSAHNKITPEKTKILDPTDHLDPATITMKFFKAIPEWSSKCETSHYERGPPKIQKTRDPKILKKL
jgi:hypothetical protein